LPARCSSSQLPSIHLAIWGPFLTISYLVHIVLLLFRPPSLNQTRRRCIQNSYIIRAQRGVLRLADHNWSASPTRCFYDHSYLAPAPSISTIQKLRLCITKAFAHHVRYATQKFIDHPAHTLPPNVLNPSYPGQ
jgi:hypothetical protein